MEFGQEKRSREEDLPCTDWTGAPTPRQPAKRSFDSSQERAFTEIPLVFGTLERGSQ